MMGKWEFAVEEDAYPVDNIFPTSLCSGLHDHAVWEGAVDGVGCSIFVSTVEV
jgi:hypothetical protein